MYTSLLPLLLCASSAVAQTFANTTFANATICSQTDDGFASVINNTFVTVDCNLAAQTCRNYIGSNNAYWTSRLTECDACNRAYSCCNTAPNANHAQCAAERSACGPFNSTGAPAFYVSQAQIQNPQTVCLNATATSASVSSTGAIASTTSLAQTNVGVGAPRTTSTASLSTGGSLSNTKPIPSTATKTATSTAPVVLFTGAAVKGRVEGGAAVILAAAGLAALL